MGSIQDATGRMLVAQGLASVATVLVSGGTQATGPITGSAGPPLGLSGTGGEVVLTSCTLTLSQSTTVMLLALCSNSVTTGVAHISQHPLYFRIDSVSEAATAYGFTPVFSNGDAEIRAHSSTILKIVTLAAGPHTINVVWNSEDGTSDTIANANNPLYVFQLGG